MAKNAVLLLYDYLEGMSTLTDEEFGRLCRFLLRYSSTGETTDLPGNERFFANLVMMTEDRMQTQYRTISEHRREAGRKGGRSRADISVEKPPQPARGSQPAQGTEDPDGTQTRPEEPQPVPSGENSGRCFVPPTLAQVEQYCAERADTVSAQVFFDYYARRGWRLSGGSPMRDWRAAVRAWRDREHTRAAGKSAPQSPEGSSGADCLSHDRCRNDRAVREMLNLMKTADSPDSGSL